MAKAVSAGVIVTDRSRILLGHVTGNKHWDIPKGKVDPGETHLQGAVRELYEETSLRVDPSSLLYLGLFPYKKSKDLSIWLYHVSEMPDPSTLECLSTFDSGKGIHKKEMDRFALVEWDLARAMVIKPMWSVLLKAMQVIDEKL